MHTQERCWSSRLAGESRRYEQFGIVSPIPTCIRVALNLSAKDMHDGVSQEQVTRNVRWRSRTVLQHNVGDIIASSTPEEDSSSV